MEIKEVVELLRNGGCPYYDCPYSTVADKCDECDECWVNFLEDMYVKKSVKE